MEFSKFEVAAIKRTAQNVDKYVSRKNKLIAQVAVLNLEITQLQAMISGWQEPIKTMTGGFTTEDLITKVIDKSNEKIHTTKYELKYPDTIIPPVVETEKTEEATTVEVSETTEGTPLQVASNEGVNLSTESPIWQE